MDFERVVDGVAEAIFVLDRKGKFLFVNNYALNRSGYSEKYLLGKKFTSIIPKDHHKDAQKIFKQIFHGKVIRRLEIPVKYKNKSIRIMEFTGKPLKEKGKIIGAVGTAKDITERKKAEEKLLFTQATMDKAGDATFWMKKDARFFYVNDKAIKTLGYSRKELLNMTVHDIDPLFPKKAWPAHWRDVKKRKTFSFESQHKTKKGKLIPVEITVNYLKYRGKEYNIAFAKDITERKKSEQELEKKVKELERFRKFAIGREMKMVELKKKLKRKK